jgi:hypothetical protein
MGYWFQLKKLKLTSEFNGGTNFTNTTMFSIAKNTNYNRSANLYVNINYFKKRNLNSAYVQELLTITPDLPTPRCRHQILDI